MNNLKQIGLAYAMYANDFNDSLPPSVGCAGGVWSDGACGNGLWVSGLWGATYYPTQGYLVQGYSTGKAKYITNPAVLFCPSAVAYNPNYSGCQGETPTLEYFNANFETIPGSYIIVFDNYTVNLNNNSGCPDGPYGSGEGRLSHSQVNGYACAADSLFPCVGFYDHLWHGQTLGFNVLYFDGSVKWWSNSGNVMVNACNDTYGGNSCVSSNNKFWTMVQQK
jgi:prepilin-type processing-associated H-X9-DG protein